MANENIRKVKLLKLLELLRQNTDEDHPMSTAQIATTLSEMGIHFDRRTISQDIITLNELGYEIMSVMKGHDKCYYVEDRSFSIPELKILIDAVQASSFITEKKSAELIDKISALAGTHRAEVLKRNMVCFNTRKHSNEHILYNVDALEDAILRKKKVIFYYFDLDEDGNRVYRLKGHHYVVEPIALVFNEDNYYLTCYLMFRTQTIDSFLNLLETALCLELGNSCINLVSRATPESLATFILVVLRNLVTDVTRTGVHNDKQVTMIHYFNQIGNLHGLEAFSDLSFSENCFHLISR